MGKRFSIDEVMKLGVTLSEFTRRSGGLSRDTLHRMDADDPTVRESTWAKAELTLAHIKAERVHATARREAHAARS